jgi:hypothetical protein
MPTVIKRPSTVTTAINGTAGWILPNEGKNKDDSPTDVAVRPIEKSQFLVFTGFDFDFGSANVSVDSITVRIYGAGLEFHANNQIYAPYVLDDIVKLTKNGAALVGNNGASLDYWPTRSTYSNPHPDYPAMDHAGGLWGTTWTKSEVEASTFGFAVAVKTDQWSGDLYGSIAAVDGVEIEIEYTEYSSTDLTPSELLELEFELQNPVITFKTPTTVEVTYTDTLDLFEDFLYYVLETSDTLTPVESFSYYLSDVSDILVPDELFEYSGVKFGTFTETLAPVEGFDKTTHRVDFLDYLTISETVTIEVDPAYGLSHTLTVSENIQHSEVGLITGVETLTPLEGFVGYVDAGTCRIDRIYYPRSTHE